MNMEKFNQYDDQIKSMIEGVLLSPDEKQKTLFMENIGNMKSKNNKKRSFWIFATIIAIVSITTVLSIAFRTSMNNGKTSDKTITLESESNLKNSVPVQEPLLNIPNSGKTILNDQSIRLESPQNNIENGALHQNSSSENHPQNTNINQFVITETTSQDISFNQSVSLTKSEELSLTDRSGQTEIYTNTESPKEQTIEERPSENQPEVKSNDTITHLSLQNTDGKIENKKQRVFTKTLKEWELYVSVFYRPEIIYNIIENDKYIHNAGLEFTFHPFNPRYVIRTGVGLSLSKGYYEYKVDYNQYLGSFEKLDSITFSQAENGFNLIPEYYFSNYDVFNEELNSYMTKVYRKFIYLQIPLEIGYDFYKKQNISFGFRTGPTLSLLMNQQSMQLVVEDGKDKIVQINQITPERIAANWQYMIGFNFTAIKNRLIFEIEPRFAYYFNSVYEKGDQTQSPYSANIRFAVGIK